MSASEVPNGITKTLHSSSERTVYIKADKRTVSGNVTAVIDAIHESGLERIVFLTEAGKSPLLTISHIMNDPEQPE